MTTFKLLLLTIMGVGLCAQAPHNPPEQPPASQPSKQLYQRPQTGRPYQPREDFFDYSTKLVNSNDIDYGAWMAERRRALVHTSLTNPFFWYSALTTFLVMLLMLMYGVRVLNERRKLWRARNSSPTSGTRISILVRWRQPQSRSTTATWLNATVWLKRN